jgi:hypothetical protein
VPPSIEWCPRGPRGRRIAEKRERRPSALELHLSDPAYTDRLAAFLRSVGQRPVVSAPDQVEIDDVEPDELEAYLRVWRVLYPDAEVELH